MLVPNSTTAFISGLTFLADGAFTGTQTPLTIEVAAPEPGTLALLCVPLVAILARRRGPSNW